MNWTYDRNWVFLHQPFYASDPNWVLRAVMFGGEEIKKLPVAGVGFGDKKDSEEHIGAPTCLSVKLV